MTASLANNSVFKREEWGSGYTYETLGDYFGCKDHQKNWLIKGAIAWGETSAWVGPPGSLKSALMVDMAIAIAANREWHGRRTKAHLEYYNASVVYFALERADLVKRRIEAQIKRLNLDPERLSGITVVPCTLDLANEESTKKIVRTVKNIEAFTEEAVGILIFDTFAKLIAAGGGDEDKAKDQGKVLANIARAKEQLDFPHVALVGHTGKDETRGARGSNAILGDVDVMVAITGGEIKTATVLKANDMAEGPLFSFKGELFEFGKDEDGDPITVNIISADTVEAQSKAQHQPWSKGLRFVRTCIDEALINEGVDHKIERGPMVRAVTLASARAIHQDRYVSNGDGNRAEAERKAWARNFKSARENGLIGAENVAGKELIWII